MSSSNGSSSSSRCNSSNQVPDDKIEVVVVVVAMSCDETLNDAMMEDAKVKRPEEDSCSQPVVATNKGSFAGYSSGTVVSHIKICRI